MKQGFTQWLLGLSLVAFPLGCLVLTFYLAYHPPQPMEETVAERQEPPAVPRPAEVKQLPDFAAIGHIPDRKRAFFEMLVPMVEWRNHQLEQLREDVTGMRTVLAAGKTLSGSQRAQLERLRIHFRVDEDNYPNAQEALDELHKRVDILPMEMVLAQGAAESGWGTSRFAQEANNLFGQWCYRKGCGLVPGARPDGMSYEVQKFSTVNEAVSTYFRNINTNRAYREVRDIRAQQRAEDGNPTGMAMVEGLIRYSSRGQAYIEELKELIRYNELEQVHEAWLAPEESEAPAEVEAESQTEAG
ncbi:glucosaminidase domain-containing protein [Marinimicrobium sp. C6131]|uniref:glucosaminidase domain-containing protein n=1 Tax=Marinimicrobium sp. C6131 TaxID=3022676 RepID=UPI00223D31A3|nr:glucosaminidase domain-containing protein [Marinimicrobium sp. C6131]UZJ43238.1 glucosaminidase domain-containing protein [Marinimicrobium sp. C6131]